jgi:hypothetical protein
VRCDRAHLPDEITQQNCIEDFFKCKSIYKGKTPKCCDLDSKGCFTRYPEKEACSVCARDPFCVGFSYNDSNESGCFKTNCKKDCQEFEFDP